MESAFLRMWDPKIFCSSVVLWSSVVHAFWCYPGSVVHIFLTLSWLVPGPLNHYQNCCSFYPPHSFNFDFKVFVFWESFSYFHWSVLFREMDISMNTQLVSCLFLITMSGLWPLSQYLFVYISICHKIVMLSCYCFGLMLRPFLICVYIHLFADVPVEVWPWQLCWCEYVFSIGQLMITVHPATIWWIVSWNWPQILCIGSVPSFRILLRQ